MADQSDDDKTRTHIVLTKDTMVSHYRIIEKIGAGGMGEVFLAEDAQLKRQVALKFLPAHYATDEAFKARFIREAEATARLNHPNIVTIHEVGEYQNRPFFAMELVSGQALKQFAGEREMPIATVLDLAYQICDGLAAAHKSGVSHRDIKPSNILIDAYGRPRILDFGLATIEGGDQLTQTGSTMGTIQYMSPEQTQGRPVDYRTDLFSFGVVLYELLTGNNPFVRDNAVATGQAIVGFHPEPMARYRNDLPEMLTAIVAKLLEKDPELRYQSARDVLADLRRIVRDEDSSPSSPTLTSFSRPPIASKPRRRNLVWPLVGLAVVVIIIGGYWLWFGMGSGSGPPGSASSDAGWQNSIAVLPFRDFSAAGDQEYFCDGITDAIIGKLSGLSRLKVISMTSAMRYKGSDRDLKKIGRDLDVGTILEGSVQREGDRIRIRAQLISIEDDAHLWSDTYDRELQSIFSVQDEISHSIVDVMKIQLLGDERTDLERRGTENTEAYSLYMQGRFAWRKRNEEDIRGAIESFEAAIVLDSSYAEAWSGLADAWAVLAGYSDLTLDETLPRAREAATRALAINDELAEAHASMGLILWFEDDFEEAEREFRRAKELNPGYVWTRTWYSSVLSDLGRTEESARELEASLELDPLNLVSLRKLAVLKTESGDWDESERLYRRITEIEPHARYRAQLANFLYQVGKVDEAVESYRQIIADNPTYRDAYQNLAYTYVRIGRFDDAMALVDEFAAHVEDSMSLDEYQGQLCGSAGQYERAAEYFRRAGERNPESEDAWSSLTRTLIQLGLTEEALVAASRRVEVAEGHPYALLGRSDAYAVAGDLTRALADCRKAIDLFPESIDARDREADIHLLRRDYEAVARSTEMLAGMDNAAARAVAGDLAARSLVIQGRFSEALETLDSGMVADSLDGMTSQRLRKQLSKVFILEELGRIDEAILNLREYIASTRKSNPFEILAWRDYLAQLLARQGRIDEAREAAEAMRADIVARQRVKSMSAYELALGAAELEAGDYQQAYDHLKTHFAEETDRLSSNYMQANNLLARACLKIGAYDEAAALLTDVLGYYSTAHLYNPIWTVKAHYYLGRAYEGLGRREAAIEQYQTFLDIWQAADAGLASVDDARSRLARL